LPFSVGVLGVAASVFRFGRETLSLVRQNEFLSIFKKHAWKGPELRNALEEIKNLSDVSRERTLPDWLNEDLALKGGKDYLNDLLKKVYRNDPSAIAESTQLLDTMRSFASKKRILHVLGMTAAFIGAVSCISCFIVCPLAVTIAFLVVIGLLGTVIYMTRRGYVENRNGGFSFSNCVPLFLQNLPDKITGLAGRLVMSNPAQTVQPTPRQFPRLPRHVLDQEFRPRVNLKLSPLSQRQVTSLDARMPTRRYQSMRRPRVLNTAIA
ncbi:MAG TPA: hypothetical protein VMR37_05460, partial [Rhabdochlamydiaceae bacterium]|nr:hypothetical protein [Rhabdochlamydiaceae bacterium]